MTGSHLRVDLDALEQVTSQLDGLKSEFEQSTRLADVDDVDDTVGSDAVRDARQCDAPRSARTHHDPHPRGCADCSRRSPWTRCPA